MEDMAEEYEEQRTHDYEQRRRDAFKDVLACLKEMVAGLLATSSLGLNDSEVARLKRAEAAIAKAEGLS